MRDDERLPLAISIPLILMLSLGLWLIIYSLGDWIFS